ncbi:LOW QUALITY PROTEIN: uromodulin-like 1 [Camelus ferus]|uniref:LOW QUALITY PROTEIN: uromodulin-like 1 n=1 Tax=Camelus ferus TaxID=419612 RepID=A0A8B8RHP6_CAMFR|nr:LOW QUALITY PROTEIN: uromodulin-like 1 [Camelus ferus]
MLRTLGLALLAVVSAVGPTLASGFTEKVLSLLSYQLCNQSVARSVPSVEAVQTSLLTHVPCGRWVPWRRCPKTVYRTRFQAVEVPEWRNVTDCCEGYEQLGLYCVLPLNRSAEFASRPGTCPTVGPEASTSLCALDTDCPGLQKCCPWPGGLRCVAPAPRAPEGTLAGFWYNVTVLVKMDFKELRQVDPGLRDHMRLLHSMVAGALQPLDTTVHHLRSAGGATSTTVSWLLLGLPRPAPAARVSSALDGMVQRVYEVMAVQVQDVNECSFDELHTCPARERCVNVEGSYRCVCPPGSLTSSPQELDGTCEDCPPLRDHVTLNVTSSSFHVSWRLNSTQNHSVQVEVYKGEELLRTSRTRGTSLEVAGLEAGVQYGVKTSYQACGANIAAALTVKTDARVFEVTVRILNHNVTERLLDRSSPEYRNFSRQLLHEVENSFPPAVSDLYRRGKLRVQIVSLQAGSVVVRLRLTAWDPEFPVDVSTLAPMLPPLWASGLFRIDPRGTRVQDWDECADSLEHDCSPAAQCINLEGSYTCRCRTAGDANPSRPGRACEGDVVSPTGAVLTPVTGETAPAPSTEATALGLETPARSPSPAHPWDTPAVGQAWTPGPPPRRGVSGTVGYGSNSTGQGVEEEASTALGLETGQWTASRVANTAFAPRAPGPTPSPLPRATDILLDPLGGLPPNSTTELPFWPTPTEGPTGHIEWHASLPTRDTLAAPLDPTWPQNSDPGPSGSPDLPSAPAPASPKIPACAPVPVGRVSVSNVTSTGFHVAWAADLTLHRTFQLTLISARGPAVHLETQNASLTLSDLEPGVLHLVEIVAKACGEESSRAHLRVRTAAQKLSGQVRIANVRYSESFRNVSSGEYQAFLRLLFRAVRDSLPASMRQHLDTGGVRVEVTRIANGSVVVEFTLLIVADVDVREVSAAFLTAFQNTSLLEVVGGDTSIWDYDECERREDDCGPGSTCRNSLGSFACSCGGGTPGFSVEYSGRPCEGDPSGNTTRPPTPAGTGTVSAQGHHLAPQGLPPRLNLTGAVKVLCEIEKVAIAIQRRFLQQESIPESSLHLGHPSCGVSDRNSTHVILVAAWNECGTVVQSNMTNTVVRTVLRNDVSPEGVIHHPKILSPIHCAFQNDLLMSSGYTPEWGVYTIIEDLHGSGSFVTEMQLFIGDSPIPQNYSVSASDDIKIEVGLYKQKSNLKVVLTECWATPSSNARDPVMFGFINNSCPIPNTHTIVIENGNSYKAQVKLKIFSFTNNSMVYLHCKLRICLESPGTTCQINCDDFRSPRSGETSVTHQMSWGPLIRSEGPPPGAEPGLGSGYLVLIAVAVLAAVAGAAALLITRYQRVTGKYSFRTQADNFSYQVFRE